MSFDLDDPKLTAYALGELDEAEHSEMEARLNHNAEARLVVDEIRNTADVLRAAVATEATAGLASEQVVRIEKHVTDPPRRAMQGKIRHVSIAAAAALLLVCFGIWALIPTQHRTREVRVPSSSNLRQVGKAGTVTGEVQAPDAPQRQGVPFQINAKDAQKQVPYNDILRYPSNWPGLSEGRTVNGGLAVQQTRTPAAMSPAPLDASDSILFPRERSVALERGEARGDGALATHLERRLPELRLDNSSFADVIEFLRDVSGANIFVDWTGLEKVGVTPDTPVSLRMHDVKLSEAMRRVLDSVQQPGVRIYVSVDDGVVMISPREEMNGFNTEAYDRIVDNPFLDAVQNPLSTFSIDVDTASYSNIRRFLNEGQLPPKDAVRIEEMVNYFTYDYPAPAEGGEAPFSSSVEIASCPWNSQNRLVRVALKGREIAHDQRPMTNLVFLIDVSGSMKPENKLPLLKRSMQMLVDQLGANDRVAIVVYAGSSGLVLPSTPCDEAQKGSILHALESLHAGGSTNGGQGIELAYNIATENFIEGGVNRVILCTDGDFNVGITDQGALTRLIEDKAKTGVFLSVLGFGMGNVKDATMEILTNKGNGNYAYIDTINEARKVLVEQLSGTLLTIAKDVKIQVEFNPAQVQFYRLIGYENRMLAKEDFNDDARDAGEIGAGHTVTALYEVVPAGKDAPSPTTQAVDDLKYQTKTQRSDAAGSGEALTLKLRYKDPDGDTSKLLEFPVNDGGATYAQASEDFKFAASVAAFGMILRDSPHKGQVTLDGVIELAEEGKGRDQHGYRTEFIELVRKTKERGK